MLYPRRVRQLVSPAVASLSIEPLSNTSQEHIPTRYLPRKCTM